MFEVFVGLILDIMELCEVCEVMILVVCEVEVVSMVKSMFFVMMSYEICMLMNGIIGMMGLLFDLGFDCV